MIARRENYTFLLYYKSQLKQQVCHNTLGNCQSSMAQNGQESGERECLEKAEGRTQGMDKDCGR